MKRRFGTLAQCGCSRFVVPAGVLVLILGCLWIYCHLFCIVVLYRHLGHRAAAVGLLITHICIAVLLWIILAQIVLIGPGRQPKLLPFRILPDAVEKEGSTSSEGGGMVASLIPPYIYPCDTQGYPIWCSNCQSLKADRTHHSAALGYCVARFDHYCVWVGTAVGRRNYRLFLQYLLYFTIHLLIVISSLAAYMRRIIHDRSEGESYAPAIICVVFALACLALLFVLPLLGNFVYNVVMNTTMLEQMLKKRDNTGRKYYYCVYNPADGYRYVVESTIREQGEIWRKSLVENLRECLGRDVLMWILPVGSSFPRYKDISVDEAGDYYRAMGLYSEEVSERYKHILMERIVRGEYTAKLRVYGDWYNKGSAKSTDLSS